MAEVLITLGIIGVVASMTMPVIIANIQSTVLKSQFKKTYSILTNVFVKAEADLGFSPQCFYWDKSPYSSASCVERTEQGDCRRYELADGSPLPSDYNGPRENCSDLGNEIINNLKIIKVCNGNAFRDGCIPEYEGNDTLRKASDDSLTEYDLIAATSGCSAWRKDSIKTKNRAYVLADGQIIMVYGNSVPSTIWAVDINGKKGPNKWGYDLFGFQTVGSRGRSPKVTGGGCMPVDKGGVSSTLMIQNMSK